MAGAFDALLASGSDYVQARARWPAGKVQGNSGGRGLGTRLYSLAFSVLVGRRVTDATNGFRIFRTDLLQDPRIDLEQRWLDSYDLEPYVLYRALTRGYKVIEYPVTVVYHQDMPYTKMRGIKDWWRLFRPALMLRTRVRR